MIFEVAIGDRVCSVRVVPQGALLHVELDGRVHVVDARRINDSVVSLLVQSGTGGTPVRSFEASFAIHAPAHRRPGDSGSDIDVHVAGRMVPVQIRAATRRTRQGASAGLKAGQLPGSGPQRVTSPMPGRIVRVLVKAGDQVVAKQGLVVVEAMKMENELRAARDGRVRELLVAQGQSVDAGTVLLVVE